MTTEFSKTIANKNVAQIRMTTLKETAKLRPKKFLELCLKYPSVISKNGKWVYIPLHRYSALREQFKETSPTITQRIFGFFRFVISELRTSKKLRIKLAHPIVFIDRSIRCSMCPYSKKEIFGLNTCGRCGCTRAKLAFENARCPENRWRH